MSGDKNMSEDNQINVFIIGSKGYTQNYGGWEAFVHGLLDNWEDKNVHFYAFEKVSSKAEEETIIVNNVVCIRICEVEQGSSAMMKYDKKCTDYARDYIKKNSIPNPILFHLGVRIGPYLYFMRSKFKKEGILLMENPAGAEWRRTKWNKVVQIYLFMSAMMMAKSTDCMVCDNEGIRNLYRKILIGKKPKLECVAYGVQSVLPVNNEISEDARSFFEKWNIKKDQYYLILGRYVPENNYEMMIKAFMKSNTKRKLLIITNYKTELQKFHRHILKSTDYENDERIIMAGALYNKEILHYVRQYARGYIHGHSVGGTNPGLLEAMSETNVCMLFDVSFNKCVGNNAALYFENEEELTSLIDNVDKMDNEKMEKFGEKARERMKQEYAWKHIVHGYNIVIHNLLKNR